MLAREWTRLKLPVAIKSFRPLKIEELYRVHERAYVDAVLTAKLANGYGNHSRAIAKSLPWVCGSFVRAVEYSMKTRHDAWSLTSGAHHAHFRFGGAFCTFNFLMSGAVKARDRGAKKIVLLDFDRHVPDGCRAIQREIGLPELHILAFGDKIIETVDQTEEWLQDLPRMLLEACDGADIIFFNAGVDPAETDILGGVMSSEQMARRDRYVFETAASFGVPIVTSLAGGYSRDERGSIKLTLDLHTQTLLQYLHVQGRR